MPTLTYSPSVYNLSCHWPRASLLSNGSSSTATQLPSDLGGLFTGYDVFRCIATLIVTSGLICGNLVLALAVNNKYTTGILQFQAVLFGALSQHNAILWILVALDRFIFATKRRRYLLLASSKVCVWVVGVTWSLSFAYYTSIVLPYSAFDYRNEGLAGCEPVPQVGVLKLVSTCSLYFPTTMTLLYVYGTVFHSRVGHHQGRPSSATPTRLRSQPIRVQPPVKSGSFDCSEQCTPDYCNVKLEESVTRSMATMSLAFIINSTPWIIKQIIIACLGNEVVPWLDFVITWSFLSLGVWNPLLCWLLCPPIRDGVRHVVSKACVCCYSNNYSQPTRRSSTWVTEISTVNGVVPQCELHPNAVAVAAVAVAAVEHHLKPHPNSPSTATLSSTQRHQSSRVQHQAPSPLPPPPPPPQRTSRSGKTPAPDSTEHDERVWGEILERSLSSGSLHHLQRLHRNHSDDDNDSRNDEDERHIARPSGAPLRSAERGDQSAVNLVRSTESKRRTNGNSVGSWLV